MTPHIKRHHPNEEKAQNEREIKITIHILKDRLQHAQKARKT
jgi:hypothetical protein